MTKALLVDERKKKCPVCGAVTFENARLCYGCMHRFIDDTYAHLCSCDNATIETQARSCVGAAALGTYACSYADAAAPFSCVNTLSATTLASLREGPSAPSLTDAFTDAFADVCSAQPPSHLRKSVANYAAL